MFKIKYWRARVLMVVALFTAGCKSADIPVAHFPEYVMMDGDSDGFIDGDNNVLYKGYIYLCNNNSVGHSGGTLRDLLRLDYESFETEPLFRIQDEDEDGLPDYTDRNPKDSDDDDDGLLDGYEAQFAELDPTNPDSDGDGLPDGLEVGCVNPGDKLPTGLVYKSMGPSVLTDIRRTFECEVMIQTGQTGSLVRPTFIADADPKSTTNPLAVDSNYDGHDDGLSDANANGRFDRGEQDAASGIVSVKYRHHNTYSWDDKILPHHTYPLRPKFKGAILDPLFNDTHELTIVYQASPQNRLPDVMAMIAGKTKSPVPISEISDILSCRIDKASEDSRLWFVHIAWVRAWQTGIDVWVQEPGLGNSRSCTIRVINEESTILP